MTVTEERPGRSATRPVGTPGGAARPRRSPSWRSASVGRCSVTGSCPRSACSPGRSAWASPPPTSGCCPAGTAQLGSSPRSSCGRHRPARLLGLVRLDRRARPAADRRRRREPGRHPRVHDLARAADGLSRAQEPADRHRHRDLRRLGDRRHGGDRRRRRGGRHRRDRDGDAVRDGGAGAAAAAARAPRAHRPAVRHAGPGPASTRSARWWPRPARPGPPSSPSRSSSSSPASSCSPRSWPRSASSSGCVVAGPTGGRRAPLVPLFVLGFLACVALRSTGVVPEVRPRLDHPRPGGRPRRRPVRHGLQREDRLAGQGQRSRDGRLDHRHALHRRRSPWPDPPRDRPLELKARTMDKVVWSAADAVADIGSGPRWPPVGSASAASRRC